GTVTPPVDVAPVALAGVEDLVDYAPNEATSNVAGGSKLILQRGARLLTRGGHHVALDENVVFTPGNTERGTQGVAFYPGPEHNLDPSVADQQIAFWNAFDDKLTWDDQFSLGKVALGYRIAPEQVVKIEHTAPLTGGEAGWPDARYRELLLRAPRSVWTV